MEGVLGAMTEAILYTDDELREFDRLTEGTASRDQVERISSRMKLRKFVEQHGKPKCDAMYSKLCAEQQGRKR